MSEFKQMEAFTEDHMSGWWAMREVESGQEVGSCDGGFSEDEAKLFAAAPDLLEALTVLVDNGGIGPEYMFHDARAAIAKAIGETK